MWLIVDNPQILCKIISVIIFDWLTALNQHFCFWVHTPGTLFMFLIPTTPCWRNGTEPEMLILWPVDKCCSLCLVVGSMTEAVMNDCLAAVTQPGPVLLTDVGFYCSRGWTVCLMEKQPKKKNKNVICLYASQRSR